MAFEFSVFKNITNSNGQSFRYPKFCLDGKIEQCAIAFCEPPRKTLLEEVNFMVVQWAASSHLYP